jgi:hypothetical protein
MGEDGPDAFYPPHAPTQPAGMAGCVKTRQRSRTRSCAHYKAHAGRRPILVVTAAARNQLAAGFSAAFLPKKPQRLEPEIIPL